MNYDPSKQDLEQFYIEEIKDMRGCIDFLLSQSEENKKRIALLEIAYTEINNKIES